GSADPHLALLAVCIVTVVLGQFISNVATVLFFAPVATAIAVNLGVSPVTFLMALTVAGAASFLTPVAT
ncbi:SLC13 family permease, partial [Bacillus pseudomycoides]|uniref:SLC13 family permease n=1 Tax=Bacillus pseudomycoides TaxID=64104 RepID=UPI001155FFF4